VLPAPCAGWDCTSGLLGLCPGTRNGRRECGSVLAAVPPLPLVHRPAFPWARLLAASWVLRTYVWLQKLKLCTFGEDKCPQGERNIVFILKYKWQLIAQCSHRRTRSRAGSSVFLLSNHGTVYNWCLPMLELGSVSKEPGLCRGDACLLVRGRSMGSFVWATASVWPGG